MLRAKSQNTNWRKADPIPPMPAHHFFKYFFENIYAQSSFQQEHLYAVPMFRLAELLGFISTREFCAMSFRHSLEAERAIEHHRVAFRDDVAEQLQLAAARAGLASSITVC